MISEAAAGVRQPRPIPPRRDADEPDDLREEIAVVNERDKVYREQREPARLTK